MMQRAAGRLSLRVGVGGSALQSSRVAVAAATITAALPSSHCLYATASRAYSTLPRSFRGSRSSRLASSSPSASLSSPHTLAAFAPSAPSRSMFIQTQSTPNPNSLKFLPGRDVSPARSVDFASYRDASRSSPLAASLLGIDGVVGVYLGPDFLSVNVRDGADWSLVKPEVYAAIMDFYASGKPVLIEGEQAEEQRSSTTILPTDSEVVAMIKELIETRIRPAVQEDGGDIDYVSFDEESGKVLVQMQGSCKGCASSAITLKNGIENMLMHYVPEVKCVEEFVDEVMESVSDEQLKKLEEKLEKARIEDAAMPIPKASPH